MLIDALLLQQRFAILPFQHTFESGLLADATPPALPPPIG